SDESYEFVDMQLKNPEALPKISDFSVWNEEGDITEDILSGKKVLILISNINKMSEEGLAAITPLIQDLTGSDIEPVVVAASSDEEIRTLLAKHGWNTPQYMGDATVVKTIIRSNPGIVLLKEGTVINKFQDIIDPTPAEVNRLLTAKH